MFIARDKLNLHTIRVNFVFRHFHHYHISIHHVAREFSNAQLQHVSQSQGSPCWICDGKYGTGKEFAALME
jgi:hypothetical protein